MLLSRKVQNPRTNQPPKHIRLPKPDPLPLTETDIILKHVRETTPEPQRDTLTHNPYRVNRVRKSLSRRLENITNKHCDVTVRSHSASPTKKR